MSATLGIVEAPYCKAVPAYAGRRFGNKSLLEWIVRRVTDSLLLDQVVIVTDREQSELIERLAPPDVDVFVGSQSDSLGRVAAAVRHFDADQVVRVPICCPFVDPELIDRLVCTAGATPNCDYIGYFSLDGRPAVLSRVGLFGEWCSARAIGRANSLAKTASDRSNALQYVFSHPELFQLRFIPIPEKLDRCDVRLTIEGDEDWDIAHLIFEALGPERLDWQRIVGLLDEHPALRARMASLNEAATA
jgi:spore coat polysaccharide biosynthesis protein SpsF